MWAHGDWPSRRRAESAIAGRCGHQCRVASPRPRTRASAIAGSAPMLRDAGERRQGGSAVRPLAALAARPSLRADRRTSRHVCGPAAAQDHQGRRRGGRARDRRLQGLRRRARAADDPRAGRGGGGELGFEPAERLPRCRHPPLHAVALGGAAKRRFEALPASRRAAIEADLSLLRHELHAINSQKAWLVPADTAVMRKIDDGTKAGKLVPVSGHSRRLARTIYLGITFRHRWPRFQRLAMRFDDRAGFGQDGAKAWLEPAHPGGLFAWWLHLKTKTMETPVLLPIRGWGRDRGDPSSTLPTRFRVSGAWRVREFKGLVAVRGGFRRNRCSYTSHS